jgi:hypothetical protein
MSDDELQLGASRARQCGFAITLFLQAESPEERLRALQAIQDFLPSTIRVRDHDGLHVYYDQGAVIPKMLAHAASYIEMKYPDGRAEVKKGGFGPTHIQATEPTPKSAIERLLEDDDLV